jgi:hypothetical protein
MEPPAAAIDLSAVRLPHGALAISAHLRRAAIFDGDSITTVPRSSDERNVTARHGQNVTLRFPAVTNRA